MAVRDGHAKFRVPVAGARSEVLVIVSALACQGPTLFAWMRNQSRTPGVRMIGAHVASWLSPSTLHQSKLSPFPPEKVPKPATGLPPLKRDFSMMVRDGDVASASNYLSVRGVLRAVGKRVQVYVASEDVGRVEPELLEGPGRDFDDRIFPVAAASVGLARDVDGDGRFTVFLSSWLSRLGNGRNAVDGFVRVSDLDLAFSAPFGNRCDMMYLSTSLKPGPHLRTVLTHEYMHAVVFSGKIRTAMAVGQVIQEEEGWLDEALAHLAEDQQAFSRSNIDYRISAFLSQPERYQLVVDDYYAANLFRSHGNRGSTYLFLRWCVDQYGPELMPALIHSRLRGIANLEKATGCSFAELLSALVGRLVHEWSGSGVEAGTAGNLPIGGRAQTAGRLGACRAQGELCLGGRSRGLLVRGGYQHSFRRGTGKLDRCNRGDSLGPARRRASGYGGPLARRHGAT